jgi:hypothetical protein
MTAAAHRPIDDTVTPPEVLLPSISGAVDAEGVRGGNAGAGLASYYPRFACLRFRRGDDPISSREPDWAFGSVMVIGTCFG